MKKKAYYIKKVLLLLSFMIFVFGLMGCETDLPPEPGAPGPIGQAIVLYQNYGPPYDVFNSNSSVFTMSKDRFVVVPPRNYIDMDLDVSHTGAFIYKNGYYYNSKY